MPTIIDKRRKIIRDLFGDNVPELWCPPLTHYTDDGRIDAGRIETQWLAMLPFVRSFLVPGSTGDGWELTEDESLEMLGLAIDLAVKHGAVLLAGALRTETGDVLAAIDRMVALMKDKSGFTDPLEAMKACRVYGFVACPPKGTDLGPDQIQAALAKVLDLGLPVALYQLPQITENEFAPETAQALAETYPHFIMMKDSGGNDDVAKADRGKSGVFLVRGAEGDYIRWPRQNNGPYHGFLLSTANCFGGKLSEFLKLLNSGNAQKAQTISDQLTGVISRVFELVADFPYGNAFTNANKAIDHHLAFGASAMEKPMPMLHVGVRLPESVVRETGSILADKEWITENGYMTD